MVLCEPADRGLSLCVLSRCVGEEGAGCRWKKKNIGLAELQLFHYLSATHTQASKYTQDLGSEPVSFPSWAEMGGVKRGRNGWTEGEWWGI